jgi:hypothetical protein
MAIDASIAAKADFEYLYDKPYENRKKVRVAGPFTVESLSPHRVLGVGADDELLDPQKRVKGEERGVKGGESAAFGQLHSSPFTLPPSPETDLARSAPSGPKSLHAGENRRLGLSGGCLRLALATGVVAPATFA